MFPIAFRALIGTKTGALTILRLAATRFVSVPDPALPRRNLNPTVVKTKKRFHPYKQGSTTQLATHCQLEIETAHSNPPDPSPPRSPDEPASNA